MLAALVAPEVEALAFGVVVMHFPNQAARAATAQAAQPEDTISALRRGWTLANHCDYWQDIGAAWGGKCTLGLHGGMPSYGVCSACPKCKSPPVKLNVPPPGVLMAVSGPKLWAELHARAQQPGAIDTLTETAWLSAFGNRVPCGICRQHWTEHMHQSPPNLSSREAYYRWTVMVHNRVNVALGKPIFVVAADR